MEVSPTKQPQGRKGEQDVSNTFGIRVGSVSEGKADQIFSESRVDPIRTSFPGPRESKACTSFRLLRSEGSIQETHRWASERWGNG